MSGNFWSESPVLLRESPVQLRESPVLVRVSYFLRVLRVYVLKQDYRSKFQNLWSKKRDLQSFSGSSFADMLLGQKNIALKDYSDRARTPNHWSAVILKYFGISVPNIWRITATRQEPKKTRQWSAAIPTFMPLFGTSYLKDYSDRARTPNHWSAVILKYFGNSVPNIWRITATRQEPKKTRQWSAAIPKFMPLFGMSYLKDYTTVQEQPTKTLVGSDPHIFGHFSATTTATKARGQKKLAVWWGAIFASLQPSQPCQNPPKANGRQWSSSI